KATFKQQREYAELTERIARLEEEKAEVEALLSGQETDPEKIADASRRIAGILSELAAAEDRWLELSELVEG
ncbi:MAG: ABC transporter ATP-binding protein, partial [Bacteroidales bacterium]|nr:ABC transporter ATP-binding protein [Bacteroidales bacterium]